MNERKVQNTKRIRSIIAAISILTIPNIFIIRHMILSKETVHIIFLIVNLVIGYGLWKGKDWAKSILFFMVIAGLIAFNPLSGRFKFFLPGIVELGVCIFVLLLCKNKNM